MKLKELAKVLPADMTLYLEFTIDGEWFPNGEYKAGAISEWDADREVVKVVITKCYGGESHALDVELEPVE